MRYDELATWREQTRSAFIHRMLPGDHFFLHSAQELLLRALIQTWLWTSTPHVCD